MIKGQHHIAIISSDYGKTVAFYRDVLGFEIESVVERETDTMVFMCAHGIMLEIFIDPTHPPRVDYPEAMGLRHLCFHVTEIEKEHERVKALGYNPEPIKPHPGTPYRLFFVKDPDGVPIEFHE